VSEKLRLAAGFAVLLACALPAFAGKKGPREAVKVARLSRWSPVEHVELQHIDTFLEVARRGSMKDAAITLERSPSVVSDQLAALEKRIGMRLVDRTDRQIKLTAAGERYLTEVQRLLGKPRGTYPSLRLGIAQPLLGGKLRALRPSDDQGAVARTDDDAIAELPFNPAQLRRTLERKSSPLVALWTRKLASLEKRRGNADGKLAPRDLAEETDVALRAVVTALWETLGKREHSIEALAAELPTALIKAAEGDHPALRMLDHALRQEALEDLAEEYQRRVIEGGEAPGALRLDRKLKTVDWKQIRSLAKDRFPSVERHEKGVRIERAEEAAESKFPQRGSVDDHALAQLLGGKAFALLHDDPLLYTRELVEQLGDNDEVRASLGGALSQIRYERLRTRFPKLFPNMRDPKLPLDLLAEGVKALLEEDATLSTRELTERMRQRLPRFNYPRLLQVLRTHPELEAMRDKEEAVEAGGTERYATSRGPTRPLRMTVELVRLAVLLSPPGAREVDVLAAANKLLVERGLPPIPGKVLPPRLRDAVIALHGGLDQQGAAIVADLLVEYAERAPKGASHEEVLALVFADHPQLTVHKLGFYQRYWRAEPERYSRLRRYLRGQRGSETLALKGGGDANGDARYAGRWDPMRVLAGHEADALAGSLEYARLTTQLPMLDDLIGDLGGRKPLAHKQVMMVSHLLGSTVALTRALAAAGATQKGMIVVGTPYGSNEAVAETLRAEGMDVRVPELDEVQYRKVVEQAVHDAAQRARRTQEPVVVLDDGGLVAEILHSDPRLADVISQFKIVEQTTRGITAAEKLKLRTTIVNVARSRAKQREAEIIGRTVAEKVAQSLRRHGGDLRGKRIVVTGYGLVGEPLCTLLRSLGAKVEVIDPGEDAADRARADGFEVVTRQALTKADIVIGATGTQSLPIEDLRLLKDGAMVASASSKQLEIDMKSLGARSTARTDVRVAGSRARLPTRRYTLGRRRITVLGDGWPINFDGDVDSAPPEEIQITRAAMFAGAIQAAGIDNRAKSTHDIVALDEAIDRGLVKRFNALRRGKKAPPVSDPDQWREQLARLAKLVAG
jgi:adenosylhomocysteinase